MNNLKEPSFFHEDEKICDYSSKKYSIKEKKNYFFDKDEFPNLEIPNKLRKLQELPYYKF